MQMGKWAKLCLVLLFSQPVMAAELTDLFQAQVAVTGSQNQAQQAAMAAVLVKLTGNQQVLTNAAITAQLRLAANYVKQYQTVQLQGQTLLQVSLDPQKITELLQQQQIPIWGSRRPDVLWWLTEKPIDLPQFTQMPGHPLRLALLEQAKIYGLSVRFPEYDATDVAIANEQAVWSGDWSLIAQASARYSADIVQNLLFDQITDDRGQILFRLTVQQQVNGETLTQEWLNPDAMQLAALFGQQLASDLAARYAVNIQSASQNSDTLLLTIDNVNNFQDVVQVQRLFESMLTVKSTQIKQFQLQQLQIELQLAATSAEFYRALALINQLKKVDASSPTDLQNELTVEPGAESQNDEQALSRTEQLSAAEAAMEAAFGKPLANSSALNATNSAANEIAVPASESTAAESLIPATHFRYEQR